jgi:hypothetical protein
MKTIIFFIIISLALLTSFLIVPFVQAQPGTTLPEHKGFVPDCEQTCVYVKGDLENCITPEQAGTQEIVKIGTTGPCGLCQALEGFARIFNWLLTFGVTIAFFMLVFGGLSFAFTWGRPAEAIAQNKKLIMHTFLGLVFLLASWFLVNVVILIFTGQTQSATVFSENWFNPSFCENTTTSQTFQTCNPNGSNDGEPCAVRSVCWAGTCVAACTYEHRNAPFTEPWACSKSQLSEYTRDR